jgi:predicted enzyme related to lactoylglutathione lyase
MVPDVAESCRQVTELGGKVLLGPESIPDSALTFANLEDPNGNIIGVFCPPTE